MLLIDEVDRADDEFEALLLEALGEGSVTVPELGTFTAVRPPIVVLTSNRSRELHDALRRRCLYHWLDYPDLARVVAILRRSAPSANLALIESAAQFVGHVREPGPRQAAGGGRGDQLGRGAVGARRDRAGQGDGGARPWARWPRPPTTATWCSRRSRPTRSAEAHVDRADPGPVLGSVDRAALVAALGGRLRQAGVPVTLRGMTAFAEALDAAPPSRRSALYWLARVTLVNRHARPRRLRRGVRGRLRRRRAAGRPASHDGRRRTRPTHTDDVLAPGGRRPRRRRPRRRAALAHPAPDRRPTEDDGEDERALPELLPSAVARIADTPLDELDEAEQALLGRWLEESAPRWPTRRSRRQRVRPSGHRVALRETIAASRRTGWEPIELQRYHPVRRPLTVTLFCDVSQSMQSYATAYLHLMRAFARTRKAETFAFSTSLTRLTPALSHHSAATAVAMAGEQVTDRFGGTHLPSCLRELLASRHGNAVRGGVLVIASDGWDSDDPADLAAAMARARRRARRIVWLNPRAGARGYEPLVGSMAAALPYCDAFLPADTLRALPAVFDAIAGAERR